ncbi:hypothetical protein [Cyclobacterium plantarum]|uniref:GTP cyclohydrolase n=1 Tax=Cyclobacterium plantarum TaxID=2716263 RepID=A0ABX0H7X7_9BACT|nr:hypothetical protein [Cyclobacterium plantarum]NHE56464.1 hypothetical protein [Cyclobacterium plantarum]
MRKLNYLFGLGLLFGLVTMSGCTDDEPPEIENEEEIITDVTLTFTPIGGGSAIIAVAQDPDGEGPEELEIISNIILASNTTYALELDLENSIEGESISEEVEEEADEHMFFFGWTSGLFSDPTGDGNIGSGNRDNPVNYEDSDTNSQPLGLETTWTTGDTASGVFRVILKHQPDIKSASSTSIDGESDIDITWDITIN